MAVFDIEATGLNRTQDRLIDLSIVVLHPDGRRVPHFFRVHPGMPIPPDSTEIHGIGDEDVKGCPRFEEVVDDIDAAFEGKDLAGYNLLYFDIPLLEEEYRRCGRRFDRDDRRVLDAQKIYHFKEPRDLSAALRYYAGRDHVGAHGAEADVLATIDVIEGQLRMYDDLPENMEAMDEFCDPRDPDWADRRGMLRWQDGEIFINFGKKAGKSLNELARKDRQFLKWIVKGSFPLDVREIVEAKLREPSLPNPVIKDGDLPGE